MDFTIRRFNDFGKKVTYNCLNLEKASILEAPCVLPSISFTFMKVIFPVKSALSLAFDMSQKNVNFLYYKIYDSNFSIHSILQGEQLTTL